MRAAMSRMFNPTSLLASFDALAASEPDPGLRPLLVEVVTLLQQRAQHVTDILVMARHVLGPPGHGPGGHGHGGPHPGGHPHPDPVAVINGAVTALLVPHAHELRCPAAEVAQVVTGLVLATVRPGIAPSVVPLAPEKVVGILLDGLLIRPQEAPC